MEDANAKVGLIETEIAFNQAVTDTLEGVQRVCQQIEAGRAASGNGQITVAIELLESTESDIQNGFSFANTNVMNILSVEVARLRQEVVEALRSRWDDQLKIDQQKGEFRVCKDEGTDSLDNTIASLSRVGIIESANAKLQKDLLSTVIDPILLPGIDQLGRGVIVADSGIRIESKPSKASVSETLDRITKVLDYLQQNLPSSVSAALPGSFIPTVASKIIATWLSSAIPTDLDGLGNFEETLDHVLQFTRTIESWGWSGQEELVSWVNQAPRLWLTRRRVDSLDSVRKVIAASQGTTKQVERIEKEQVSQADGALLENAPTDDWDAGWDDDKEEDTGHKPAAPLPAEEEEDVSAWGLDEDEDEIPKETKPQPPAEAEDDTDDAWGWGDEDEDAQKGPSEPSQPKPAAAPLKSANGERTVPSSSPREVTLKEVYTVTDIPDSIIKVIRQQIDDSKNISLPV